MSDLSILLVHGELHGAWCWRDVLPHLRDRGLRAQAIDLPGHGADPTPVADVTFESYARAIISALSPRTLVVAHGMAGYAASAAAEAATDKIAGLVYLSAYIPVPQKSVADLRAAARQDPLEGNTRPSDDGLSFAIRPDAVHQLLYHDCPPGTLTYAAARINREPIAPLRAALNALSRATGVPRYAIVTENDRMLDAAHQHEMASALPASHVTTMATSHSAFFAQPETLANRLAQIAAELT